MVIKLGDMGVTKTVPAYSSLPKLCKKNTIFTFICDSIPVSPIFRKR
jgi:hypothetical protein